MLGALSVLLPVSGQLRILQVVWLILVGTSLCRSNTLANSKPPVAAKLIENRLVGFSEKLETASHQIVNIQTKFKIMVNSYQLDMNKLEAEITELTTKLEEIVGTLEEQDSKIVALTDTIAALEEDVAGLKESTGEMEEANERWKNNFLIVNRTFAILRKAGCIVSTS